MKKASLIVVIACITFSLKAQIKPKTEDWIFYDYTYSHFLNAPTEVAQRFIPNSHAFSLIRDIPFGKGRVALGLGLGYSSTNYYNNLGIVTNVGDGKESFAVLGMDSIEHNKLRNEHLDGLLELRFRGKPNDKGRFFRFYIGGRFGFRINSYSRLRTDKINVQYNDLGALNRFRYGLHVRLGFGAVSLFGYYGLSDIFTEGTIGTSNSGMTGITTLSTGLSITL